MTSAVGGIVGRFLQLLVAYTVVDITAVLESDLGQPFAAFLSDILPQQIVLAVLSLTIIAGFAMGQSYMIAASCMTWVRNISNLRKQDHQAMLTDMFTGPTPATVTMMVPVLCLPSVVGGNLDLASMNWTALVYGGPMLGVLV